MNHETHQVGHFTVQHQDETETGSINHWAEVTPAYACSCGALVWEPERHQIAVAMSTIGLG